MVHGMNDRIMATFRDRFTVYPDPNKAANINTDDPRLLWAAIVAVADQRIPDPRLKDPVFIQQILTAIQTAKAFSFLGFSSQTFVNIVKAFGVAVNPQALSTTSGTASDKDDTFTLTSTGEAGSIKKKVTAVVRLGQGGMMGQGNMGTLLYWREE
jgi:general secretion pathway protein K